MQVKTVGMERDKPVSVEGLQRVEILRCEVMETIQALRSNIELKIDAVTINVNLLQADLCKVTDKVTTAESQINGLQAMTKRLEKQVQELTQQREVVAVKLEDQEGRAHHNNVRIIGVPEGAEGCSTELFIEDLILNKLGPQRLSNHFTIEKAHIELARLPLVGGPP
ncbi:hypothetical protein NDU88_005407 [Pleurodeles waltl]|uniref:Uncharacterized protein n=1 Tax=Pleurodeles waltl TaxID=8319 RepID=A0AAV7WV45_PLEWA|nr:hypothetical protein NDU88_005407 [Pleurodeles waltl]